MSALDTEARATERISRPDSWRAEFIKRNDFRCHYCNRRGTVDIGPDDRPWHLDHMIPLARGGPDDDSNLALACKRCNLAKNVQPYEQFRKFARHAFWVPDDWRLSEGDLDWLMNAYAAWGDRYDEDRDWKFDTGTNAVCVFNADGEFTPLLELGDYYKGFGTCDYSIVLQLTAEMYKALPAMIAEIRMHRAAERGDAA